jgi:hypothetical protein
MNLCMPDQTKSCAACCGLYNVPDCSRAALIDKLDFRTNLFRDTPRTVEDLVRFEATIREMEATVPLDAVVHVCEFTGFVDADARQPGCMLHPVAPGNSGVDLRGLCHYGSMACKTFFCPAWKDLEPIHREAVVALIDDWRVYGLVATDVDFVRSVFGLLDGRIGRGADLRFYLGATGAILKEMLSWKDAWPFKGGSTMRRSRYFILPVRASAEQGPPDHMATLLECLAYTFGIVEAEPEWEEFVRERMERGVDGAF